MFSLLRHSHEYLHQCNGQLNHDIFKIKLIQNLQDDGERYTEKSSCFYLFSDLSFSVKSDT